MIEHMMFKGTMSRSAREIVETIDATRGQLNAYTERSIPPITVRSLMNI